MADGFAADTRNVLILLLTAMLSVQAPDPRAEAERLARSGAYEDAIERFRALAAVDPGDLEARIWIARLHVIKGHLRPGEEVYRSILLEAPDRVEALVGLGSVLTSQGRFGEAREILGRAEQLSPDDLEVLAAQGRLNLAADRSRLALGYYGRATLMAPEQNDLRINFEEARRRYDHRIEATYFNEAFSDLTPGTQSGEVALDLRVSERFRVHGRGQQERKFSRTDTRGGGGINWRLDRPWLGSLQAHALVGPGNDILPQVETGLGLGWIGPKTTLTANGRYFRFDDAQMWSLGPTIRLHVLDDVVLSASVTRTLTQFAGLNDMVGGSSGDVRAAVQVRPRLWLEGGYARGIENLDRVTIDRLRSFRADTISGTARLDLRWLTTLAATYEYQRMNRGIKMGRMTAKFLQRF